MSLGGWAACQGGERRGGGGALCRAPSPVCSPQYSRQEQEEEGRKRYEAQKLERMETKWRNGDIVQPILNPGKSRAGVWATGLAGR